MTNFLTSLEELIMGLFDKQALGEKFSAIKDKTKETVKKASDNIKEHHEASKEAKAPIEGALTRYGVSYVGGLIQYPKRKSGEIGLNIMENSFILKPTSGAGWFEQMEIPYDSVHDLQIVKRTVSAAEGLMSSNSADLATDNTIEITYINPENIETVLRLEMLTGLTVNGTAVKCKEMIDFLRQKQILPRLLKKNQAAAAPVQDDIPAQIQKLNALKEAGILTDEEFQAKKADLLAKM